MAAMQSDIIGAAVIDDDAGPELFAEVMRFLPFGITINDGTSGHCLYQNVAALSLQSTTAAGKPRTGDVEISRNDLSVRGRLYEIITRADHSEQKLKEERLVQMAFFDDLTGLPKSALMQQTIDGMIADTISSFALSFIDLDNFKFINDYYGHGVGDQLLKKISQRISENCRTSDLLARVGGDEFVLLKVGASSTEEIAAEIERLSARLREPFFIEGFEIFTSASIGVSLYPNHGSNYEALRTNADRAMYRIKDHAKGGVKFFDASLNQAATARMEAEQRLRLAIRDKNILCAFQPKVDFTDGTVVGVEVLLRWRDGGGFLHPPGDLIKLAIELGLMDEITMIVLDQVVEQIELIDDMFGRNVSISINVAAKQAADFSFMQKFADAIGRTEHAKRFIIELTEEAFFAKGEFQHDVLPILRGHGIGVSIDDFGAGYSSLSALAEIAADELKVDRSFITQIHKKERNQTILKVIETLGKELGMRIVVEGVETSEELEYLRENTRITFGQGYFFARPMFLKGQEKQAVAPRSTGRILGSTSNRVANQRR
jgi:diguanylate cyclase (GGDEF)-like protein